MNVYFSIIVPIYNTEKYLHQCIDSVLHKQTLKNIEVILINDGSIDTSGDIIDAYAQKDSRIIAFHQQNQGIYAARNQGLKIASGEYVVFLDSDDWIADNGLEAFYKYAKNNHFDMIMGNSLFYYHEDKITRRYENISENIKRIPISGKKCFVELMKSFSFVPMVYSYIYRKEWLEEIQIQFADIIHEDELWTITALCQAKQVFIADLDFYYYRQREDSFMSSYTEQNKKQQKRRVESLFQIVRALTQLSDIFSAKEDGELREWLHVKIAELSHYAFDTLLKIKDSSYMPEVIDLSDLLSIGQWSQQSLSRKVFMSHLKQAYLKMKEYQSRALL